MVHLVRQEPALANSDARRRPGFDRISNWTPADPANYREAAVDVYSNCDEVELVLNGKSLGAKPKPADASPRAWKVPFEAGTLKAIGKNAGQVAANHELRTAGAPAKLVLTVDRAKLTRDWNDVSCVTVVAIDANGVPCAWADTLVSFTVEGPGVIAGVDNGDRADPAAYQASERKLFQGECIALIKANADAGTITLTASAAGLPVSSIKIEAAPAP
jgi:beta-galactosidase